MAVDLGGLNGPQHEAVITTEGPLLVLAGAGSGKTRVLTYRIAHMVEDLGIHPWNILAITFTNKAAAEMRERLKRLIGENAQGMWVSTFHSMCGRILRANASLVGRTRDFTICDPADMKRLTEAIIKDMDLNPKMYAPKTVLNMISDAKNNLVSPAEYANEATNEIQRTVGRIYERLQKRLQETNAFDFDDLLMYTYLLLKDNPTVLAMYQDRFRYILVDEYQDTNKAQYAITALIADRYKNLMVVGDDDQSIYSWRGADIRNILDFENDYPEAKVIKLEQNYRSTGNILEAANAVIANNSQRKAKRLFTSSPAGEKVAVYVAADERDEGRWIAGEIEKQRGSRNSGAGYDDFAVFYRTNAQSRILEDMFLRAGIPYKIVGGTRFFDRAEIKDVMAYLTLVVNPANDIAAMRVINTPRRGIGESTVALIEDMRLEDMSFVDACRAVAADGAQRPKIRKGLQEFLGVIDEASRWQGDLRQLVEKIVNKSGLITALKAENTEEANGRIENIEELYSVVDEYVETHEDIEALYEAPGVDEGAFEEPEAEPEDLFAFAVAPAPKADPADADAEPQRPVQAQNLAGFVEWVSLRTDLDSMEAGSSAVTMMTVHAAKGLEFPVVFVAGMEESLFPHTDMFSETAHQEEERRLAYVAITRAREKLYLTRAQSRQIYGSTQANPASRFIGEIPSELLLNFGVGSMDYRGVGWEKRGSRHGISGSGVEVGGGKAYSRSGSFGSSGGYSRGGGSGRSASSSTSPFGTATSRGASQPSNIDVGKKAAADMTFVPGDKVDHKVFGPGVITAVKGDTLTIKFSRTGATKNLLKDYAPIVKVN